MSSDGLSYTTILSIALGGPFLLALTTMGIMKYMKSRSQRILDSESNNDGAIELGNVDRFLANPENPPTGPPAVENEDRDTSSELARPLPMPSHGPPLHNGVIGAGLPVLRVTNPDLPLAESPRSAATVSTVSADEELPSLERATSPPPPYHESA